MNRMCCLLDEPTNHLDLAAIEWVENYLADFNGAVILIKPRSFSARSWLTTRIAWLTQSRIKKFSRQLHRLYAAEGTAGTHAASPVREQQATSRSRRNSSGGSARASDRRSQGARKSASFDPRQRFGRSAGRGAEEDPLKISTDQRAGDPFFSVAN